jgi:hypothetical protein
MNNIHCVCTTPQIYSSYASHWENFPKDTRELIWVSDITKDPSFDLGFKYTEKELRKNLNFYGDVSQKHFWNSQKNRNIIWFYAHFRMLNFYLENPNYDYYWFFDDDVKMNNWESFFKGTDNDDSDFLGYFIFKNKNVDSQPNVPNIDDRTFSKHMWFERFPGDGDIMGNDITELFGSFFPVNRFSNRAMKKLLELNTEGLSGYSEGFVPTMLNKYGYKLSSLIKPDNTSNYFDVNEVNIEHKNIKIDWEWI